MEAAMTATLRRLSRAWDTLLRALGLVEPLEPCARLHWDIRTPTCPDCGWPRSMHGSRHA